MYFCWNLSQSISWLKTTNATLSTQVLKAKLDQVLEQRGWMCQTRKIWSIDFNFDIRKDTVECLYSEDRLLYHLQMESKGHVGYTTGQTTNAKTIDPSKRREVTLKRISTTVTTTLASESDP